MHMVRYVFQRDAGREILGYILDRFFDNIVVFTGNVVEYAFRESFYCFLKPVAQFVQRADAALGHKELIVDTEDTVGSGSPFNCGSGEQGTQFNSPVFYYIQAVPFRKKYVSQQVV